MPSFLFGVYKMERITMRTSTEESPLELAATGADEIGKIIFDLYPSR